MFSFSSSPSLPASFFSLLPIQVLINHSIPFVLTFSSKKIGSEPANRVLRPRRRACVCYIFGGSIMGESNTHAVVLFLLELKSGWHAVEAMVGRETSQI